MNNRLSGILIHPISFISKYGCGDLGEGAYKILDFLKASGQRILQILPIGPTGFSNSPYQSFSSFAGNPYFISFDKLIEKGYLKKSDLDNYPKIKKTVIDYELLYLNKYNIFEIAFHNFYNIKNKSEYDDFCQINSFWLDDFSLFMAIKESQNGSAWNTWDYEIKDRIEIKAIMKRMKERIDFYKFIQWQFFEQWKEFVDYAHNNNIKIIGDLPIFVSYDSVDVWINKELFYLDDNGKPVYIAGVPPDYFSKTGQLWGNPVYRWDTMEKNNFEWWKKRIKFILNYVDFIRIDHFRGFESYWQIPYGEETAINGKWEKVPGHKFFKSLNEEFEEKLSKIIIAEDLGIITDEVKKLRNDFNLSGMRIFEFINFENIKKDEKSKNKFGDDPYLPENYIENCIAYPGTHDNDTIQGWFKSLDKSKKQIVLSYLRINDIKDINNAVIKRIAKSKAKIVVFLMQDILELGTESRMNLPGSNSNNNWSWCVDEDLLTYEKAENLYKITKSAGRI